MAAELSKYITDVLGRLPKNHPDRAHLEGLQKVNEAYIGKQNTVLFQIENSEVVSFYNVWDQAIADFNSNSDNPEYIPDEFGKLFDFYLKQNNLKHLQLAKKTHVSDSTISRLRNGSRTPSFRLFRDLLPYLDLTPYQAVELASSAKLDLDQLRSTRINSEGTTGLV